MQTAIWEKKHMVKSQNYLLQDTSSVIQPEAESGKTLQNKKQFHTILTLIVGKEKKKKLEKYKLELDDSSHRRFLATLHLCFVTW